MENVIFEMLINGSDLKYLTVRTEDSLAIASERPECGRDDATRIESNAAIAIKRTALTLILGSLYCQS